MKQQMPDLVQLTQDDYEVFKLVPDVWWDERDVGRAITRELGIKSGDISRRIGRFVTLGIVERRPGVWVLEQTEIRRTYK